MEREHSKWYWVPVAVLVLVSIASSASAGSTPPPGDKMAVVNGSVISRADFDREMSRVQQRLLSMGRPLSDSQLSAIKERVLESLIDRELLYQESQEQGFTVEEAAINEQLSALKERFPSEAEFKRALSEANLSEAAVKSRFKREMIIRRFIDKQFVQKITVSGTESKAYYDSHPDIFKQPGQVHARHILIKVDREEDESQKVEARKKLKKVQEKLQKGEDFATLAQEFSEDPSNAKGGDLGYFARGQMVKPFEEVAFTLKPGEVSDIVETEFGYHLIKVIDKKPETTIAYEDIRERLEDHLKQDKVHRELSLYVGKLKQGAHVERFLAQDQ